jgi:hypothetical protein
VPIMRNREIAALYLELASECFHRAAKADDDITAEAMQRMGRGYIARALAVDPSLSKGEPSATVLTT